LDKTSSPRGEASRDALLAAATLAFARDGFHAVGTRAIAQAAGVNQALIGYHFGDKQGMYLAVFDNIARQILARMGGFADVVERHLEAVPAQALTRRTRADERDLLFRLLNAATEMFAGEASAPWAQLILREQQAPTEAFERLYQAFFGRLLRLLTGLLARQRPDWPETEVKLAVMSVMGQILVLRASRAGVLRHMGWTQIGPAELAAVQGRLRANVTAMLAAGD